MGGLIWIQYQAMSKFRFHPCAGPPSSTRKITGDKKLDFLLSLQMLRTPVASSLSQPLLSDSRVVHTNPADPCIFSTPG